ncbi:MAG TPA: hypothetical protein ENK33_01425 [Desulfobacterales bacterium]|nr:hypothetical protein [Desulfobacterales bacterium]
MSAKEMSKRHHGLTPGADSCQNCHDPHGNGQPYYLYKSAHPPFKNGKCNACHKGRGQALPRADMSAGSVCFKCHNRAEFQRPVVHEPVAECKNCHNMHTARYPGLLKAKAPELCLRCHDNLKVKQGKNIHQPVAAGQCLKCHAAHSASHKGLLVDDVASVCSSCHKMADYAVQHAPFKHGKCLSCHTAHGGTPQMLKSPPAVLCQGCHKLSSVKKKHKFSLGAGDCLSCHNPHGGKSPSLLRKFLHPPFKKGCAVCHQKNKPLNTALCLSCHRKIGRYYFVTHNHLTDNARGNACTTCHSPHAADDKRLLRSPVRVLCESCHQDTVTRHQSAEYRHKKMADCLTCHAAHGGRSPAMLKGNGITICTRCHTSQGKFSHPVGKGVIDHRNGRPITCITCHDPKGTNYRYNLVMDGKEALCVQCHNY